MSLKKLLILSIAGAVFGVNVWLLQNHSTRKPAAVISMPPLPVKPWSHSPFGKMNQSMTVTIVPVGGIPDSDDQELTLKAEVTLHRDIVGDAEFKWDLPDDVEVVSGHINDVWPNLKAGQTATTEISLLKVSKQKLKTVNLMVSADGGDVKYASSGSFATREKLNDSKEANQSSELSSGIMKVGNDSPLQKPTDPAKLIKLHQ